ncbi:MAG: S8 family serine peptidase, partial [Candidatus Eiseniibacteriota bacterium]
VCAILDPPAALRSFDVAVANGARVLVAEIQDTSSFFGGLAKAADRANRTGGAVVIAATGNFPGAGTVSAPASARRVLGIGAHDGNGVTDPLQSRGPTADGRIKPDVQAPLDVVTASSASNSATRARSAARAAPPRSPVPRRRCCASGSWPTSRAWTRARSTPR